MYIAKPNIWMSNLDTDKRYNSNNGNVPTQNGKKNARNKTHNKVPNLEMKKNKNK